MPCGVVLAEKAIGDDCLRLAGAHRREGAFEIRKAQQLDVDTETFDHSSELVLLDGSGQNGDTAAVEVKDGRNTAAGRRVDLVPARQSRFVVEGEQFGSFRRPGDIGHQVDFAQCQALQALLPVSRHVLDPPAFALGDGFDQVDKDTLRFAGFVQADLRAVLVYTDANDIGGDRQGWGLGESGQTERHEQQQCEGDRRPLRILRPESLVAPDRPAGLTD